MSSVRTKLHVPNSAALEIYPECEAGGVPSQQRCTDPRRHIAICVCTYHRPLMLAQCLQSLARQLRPQGVEVEIAVIDNQPDGGNRVYVEGFAREHSSCFNAHYIHEPARGISHARNAAMTFAGSLGANWVAFVDDDEIAEDPLWLTKLWEAAQEYRGQAVHGPVEYRHAAGVPSWATDTKPKRYNEGERIASAATNNVLFDVAFAREHGLCFDPAFGLTGGEDVDFFRRFTAAGGVIVWTKNAQVVEMVTSDRVSFSGRLRRSFNHGYCDTLCALRDKHGVARLALKGLRRMIGGTAKIALSPFALLGGSNLFMRTLLTGCQKLAHAAGTAAAIAGARFAYYEHTSGR